MCTVLAVTVAVKTIRDEQNNSSRGLRFPVEMLLELLSSGMTADEILADYGDLERDDLLAVFAFAAHLSRVKRVEPPGP